MLHRDHPAGLVDVGRVGVGQFALPVGPLGCTTLAARFPQHAAAPLLLAKLGQAHPHLFLDVGLLAQHVGLALRLDVVARLLADC